MRIIAGKLKGHRLKSFKADHIRPTTDRVKESIFSKLQFDIPGSTVLDLFSGTGNLSFESYSRGAEKILAVENSEKSINIFKSNYKHLKVDSSVQVVKKDVFRFIEDCQEQFDIILVDPPFTKKWAHKVMETLAENPRSVKSGWLVIESQAQERIDDVYGPYILLDRKAFGDKTVSFFTREE